MCCVAYFRHLEVEKDDMNIRLFLKGLLIVLAGLVSGCASLQGVKTEKIDHRQVEYVLLKHPTKTVVFENGLGAKLDAWAKVFPEISKDATVFAYNRPGYGKSEPVVLSALEPMKEKSELADYANNLRKEIARLYPGSKQIWVESGHNIPLVKPESVITAIRSVL